jgi:hypothetical protein
VTRPWPTCPWSMLPMVLAFHGLAFLTDVFRPWTTSSYLSYQAILGYDRCHISVCPASPLHSYPTYPDIRSACPNGSGHVDYRDVSSKGRIVPGTCRPRDELSKGRNIRYFSFRDTKTTLHPGQLQRLQRQSDVLGLSTWLTSVCTVYLLYCTLYITNLLHDSM